MMISHKAEQGTFNEVRTPVDLYQTFDLLCSIHAGGSSLCLDLGKKMEKYQLKWQNSSHKFNFHKCTYKCLKKDINARSKTAFMHVSAFVDLPGSMSGNHGDTGGTGSAAAAAMAGGLGSRHPSGRWVSHLMIILFPSLCCI